MQCMQLIINKTLKIKLLLPLYNSVINSLKYIIINCLVPFVSYQTHIVEDNYNISRKASFVLNILNVLTILTTLTSLINNLQLGTPALPQNGVEDLHRQCSLWSGCSLFTLLFIKLTYEYLTIKNYFSNLGFTNSNNSLFAFDMTVEYNNNDVILILIIDDYEIEADTLW